MTIDELIASLSRIRISLVYYDWDRLRTNVYWLVAPKLTRPLDR